MREFGSSPDRTKNQAASSLGSHSVKNVQSLQIYRVNLRIQSEYRKIQTRKNSVFGHFHAVVK